jgi:hypothetical protein
MKALKNQYASWQGLIVIVHFVHVTTDGVKIKRDCAFFFFKVFFNSLNIHKSDILFCF